MLATDSKRHDKGATTAPNNDVPMYINIAGPSPEYEDVDDLTSEFPITFKNSTLPVCII